MKHWLSARRAHQVEPVGRAVLPEVWKNVRLCPEPAFFARPEPEALLPVRLGISPAQLGMVDPIGTRLPAKGAEPIGATPACADGGHLCPPGIGLFGGTELLDGTEALTQRIAGENLRLFQAEGFGRVVVQAGFAFGFLYEIQPVARAVFPKMGPAMRSRPDPTFCLHPKP